MKYLLLALLALGVTPAVQARPDGVLRPRDRRRSTTTRKTFRRLVLADTASSYRLMVGYQFMEHLGVEGGYGKTGTIRDTRNGVRRFRRPAPSLSTSARVQDADDALAWRPAVRQRHVAARRARLRRHEQEVDCSPMAEFGIGQSTSRERAGYYFGAQYDWDRVAIRLGYEKYDFDGDIDVTETMLTFFYKL